jgi:hypothetical protein
LASEYNENKFVDVLNEIALECGFVCLTLINAAASPELIPPDWKRAVTEFVTEIGEGVDWSHLERDWEEEARKFNDLAAHVVSADQLDEILDRHPNSLNNIRSRRDGHSTT